MRPAIALAIALIALALPSALLADDSVPAPPPPTTTTTTTAEPPPATTEVPSAPPPTTTTAPTVSPPAEETPVASGVASPKSDQSVLIVDGASNSDYAYSPSAITVTVGDAVTWTNNGSVPEGHTVTGDGLDSGTLRQGESYSHTFTATGTFSYLCTLHPFMTGSVTVEAAPPSDSGGTPPAGGAPPAANPSGGGTTPDSPSSQSSDPTSTASPTAAGSESAAGSSLDAAGNASTLPQTGSNTWILAVAGLDLILAGIALIQRRRTVFRVRI